MDNKQISIGEAAKMSGLTIRALQHYDNIGVLPASGRTEGRRRYYTDKDLIKLEHIVFYRSMGFSLEQIKENLLTTSMNDEANHLLAHQKQLLYMQIQKLQNSIAAIEASEEIVAAGMTPPWTLLAYFMQSLGTIDFAVWEKVDFNEKQKQIFSEDFKTLDDVMNFYNNWKNLSIKSAAFYEAGVKPNNPIAQKLAENWETMVYNLTQGNEEHIEAFLEVDQNRDVWNSAERELMEKAEPFLNEILEVYRKAHD